MLTQDQRLHGEEQVTSCVIAFVTCSGEPHVVAFFLTNLFIHERTDPTQFLSVKKKVMRDAHV